MSEPPPPPEPQRINIRVPEHLAAGVYSTNLIVANTREEFTLDFLTGFEPPQRLVARVILNPHHAKRLAQAIRENIGLYEKQFGPMPAQAAPAIAQSVHARQAKEFYEKLAISDAVAGGVYANSVLIRHSRDEFVLDFVAHFQPSPVLTARVLASPAHVLRMVNSLEARVRGYEDSVGPLPEPPQNPRARPPQ